MERPRVLVVDDEKTVQHVLTTLLQQQGYETESAGSAEVALSKLDGGPISVAFLDIVLPGMNGLELLARIKARDPDAEVIMMTSHASAKTAIEALRKGAYDYIDKPFELDHVVAVAERATSQRRLRLENRRLQEEQVRQNQVLREAVKRLGSLNSAGIGLAAISSIGSLLDFIVELVSDELDAERVSLMLVNELGTELTIAASRGLDPSIVTQTRVPLGVGVAGRVAKEGKELYSNSDLEHPSVEAGGHPGAEGPFASIPISVSIPIRTPTNVLGVLNVTGRRERRPFTRDDTSYLSSLAGQLAVAIERARNADDLRRAYDNLRRTQDQLVATGRLKAIGEMAAGVAHDFNNLLNGILVNSQLIQRDLDQVGVPLDRLKKQASLVEKLALQGADTVRRLQDFAGLRKDRPSERVDLNDVARRAVELTTPKWQGELGASGIRIEIEVSLPSIPAITGNVRELTQAVSNLIFNAVEAMPMGGSIGIATSVDDRGVRLTVSDTGCGMSQETRERLFESFFTTKAHGQGLGMSVVHGIVRRLGGEIEIESRPGEGTSIGLVFPPAPPHATPSELARSADSTSPAERGRVLVVDDDEINREICVEVLAPLGHEVHTASSGSEALQRITRDRFDLVITDLSIPGTSGWNVAKQVKEASPSTRVMLLSGWSVQQDPEQIMAGGIDLVLSKPVQVNELAQAVQRLLRDKRLGPHPVGEKSSQGS
ncbi:MAG: response regulator [Candidatus Eisenbacteria bacterium]|uniref:histidine kinase n=1 Tax=Eiseniibacteriota bacterium TaxID=2212470 RepID=A0A538T274_UNCEI|nr:MAG: response regulator [Candidatus Eisenbacteria bacterium]